MFISTVIKLKVGEGRYKEVIWVDTSNYYASSMARKIS